MSARATTSSAALSEAPIQEKDEKRPGWERARAQGLKDSVELPELRSLCRGEPKEQSGGVEGLRPRRRPLCHRREQTEEPGADYCPLLGAILTSASHLLLALVDKVVESAGGEGVYCDTDSVFVTPSKIAPEVARAFAALNPYSRPVAFLKDETESKAPRAQYPDGSPDSSPRFIGLSCKRYGLFVRDAAGRNLHVFRTGKEKGASDHGLGSFEAPGDRKQFVAGVGSDHRGRAECGGPLHRDTGHVPVCTLGASAVATGPAARGSAPVRVHDG